MSHFALTFSITFLQGIGVEMERLAAKMGGTVKWPYNDSECLDAEFFKVRRKKNENPIGHGNVFPIDTSFCSRSLLII